MKKKLFTKGIFFLFLFLMAGLGVLPAFGEYRTEIDVNTARFLNFTGNSVVFDVSAELYKEDGKKAKKPEFVDVDLKLYQIKIDDIRSYTNLSLEKETPIRRYQIRIRFSKKMLADSYPKSYKSIKIKNLPPGAYVIQARSQKDKKTFESFLVTKIAAICKIDYENINIFVNDIKTQEPVEDTEIIVKSPKGDILTRAKTDHDGLAKIPKNFEIKEILEGRQEDFAKHTYIVTKKGSENNIVSLYGNFRDNRLYSYIFTDRPIYRPGQKIYIQCFVRYKKNGVYQAVKNKKIKLNISGPNYEKILEKNLVTDESGRLHLESTLLKDAPLGRYFIALNDENIHYGDAFYFNVEDYRKPEYEIKVLPKTAFAIQGKNAQVEVQARYLFGSPVTNAPFEYSISEAYTYFDLSNYYSFDITDFEGRYYQYESKLITEGKGHTDRNGNAVISFPTSRRSEKSLFYVSVKMKDSSNREIKGKGYIRTNPGLYEIKVKADKRVYYGDEKLRAEITAQSDKKAIPASFTIIISKKTNSSFRYSDVFKIVAEKSISADKLGKALFYYKPEQSGYYKIKAFSRDKNGNIVFNDYQFLYISKDHKLDNNEKHFYIISDKQTYTPGETATAYIILPVRNKKVFVTLEADKLHAMEVINIKGNVGVFRFPVKENYTPNVYVNVGFFNNGYFNGMFNIIRVPDTRHKLQLSVTPDRNEYKPAETALYNIKTCDSDGKPVSAQVTLGVADKSVFLLAEDFLEESVHHFFYYIRPNTVCTFPFTFNEQREYFPPLTLPSGTRFAAYTTFNGLKPGFIDPSTAQMLTKPVKIKIPREDIRSYFPDTCYFNPNIITDQNGNARVKVKLPDSLTTWRADAKGITMDTKVGESESEVKVAKKLMVRLITPRFIRQRDKLMISGIVHNYLKTAKTVKMELESSGVKMISENGIEINVPPGQNRKVEWKIEAPFAGDAEFTLRGMTDEESDGMKLNVPILPHGTEHRKNLSGFTEQKSELEFFVPKNSIPGTVKLRINISPSLGASIIPALKYLSEYPYGCTEQTLSRFLPAITALKCLKDSGILSKDIKKSIQEVTGKSLQRLAKLQHSDGGWGWWENDSSDAEFTSMVVYGLYQASESGYSIRDCDIGSGIGWLYLNYKKETDLNTRVAMLHALTFTGRGQKKWADNLFRARKKLNTSAQAKLAQTLYKMGKKAEADVMLKLLEKEAVASKTHAYWSECNQGWIENPNYVTATVLRTFIMIKPQHPICARAVRYLTSVKDNGHWETTNDTNAALTALVEYMQATKELNGDFTGSLKINGREVRAFSMKATGDGSSGIDLELSVKDLKPGKNIISFEKNGNGRLYYCFNLTWFDTEEKVKASTNRFFKETRKYYLLDNRKSADGKLRAKLLKAPYARIKTGDTIIVQTFCKSSREMKYAITEDPKPSGFETAELPKNLVLPGVDSDNYNNRNYHNYYDNFNYLNFYYDYKTEDRDDKMVDFRWFLGEGKNISIYALKPETGGVFHTMPATLSLMYFPEFRASSDEMIFEVTEGKNDKSIIVPDKTRETAEGESSFARIAGKLAK